MFDSIDNRPLLEHWPLSITFCLGLEPVANVSYIDKPALEEIMVDDQIPCSSSRQQALAVIARYDPVTWCLVGVALEYIGIEVGGVVRHGACRGRNIGSRGAGTGNRRRAQDLVLCAHLLQITFEFLVLRDRLLLCFLQLLEPTFEILDMAFLALTECSLSEAGISKSCTVGGCFNGPEEASQSAWYCRGRLRTYAARFWAFRLDWAGVRSSSSELDPCRRACSSFSALVEGMISAAACAGCGAAAAEAAGADCAA